MTGGISQFSELQFPGVIPDEFFQEENYIYQKQRYYFSEWQFPGIIPDEFSLENYIDQKQGCYYLNI